MSQNRVIKGVGGLYLVQSPTGVLTCSPRGRLKRDRNSLLIGDYVELLEERGEYSIEKILPRKNQLYRPKVANIDAVVILISTVPAPDFGLIDKMLIYCVLSKIDCYLAINKSDLGVEDLYERVKFEYGKQAKDIFLISTKTRHNLELLEKSIEGKLTCLVGQSAVGKSSLINVLSMDCDIEVGGLSKINRGRHTTRHAEIIPTAEGTYLIDTPGFSLLEFDLEPRLLKDYYFEYHELSSECKFGSKCLHINEPQCLVKENLDIGLLSKERYQRYLDLYGELENKWRKKYGK